MAAVNCVPKVDVEQVQTGLDATVAVTFNNNHPLLIDLILDNLFEYLKWRDLQTSRRVCKLWHKVSQKRWLLEAPPFTLRSPRSKLDTDYDYKQTKDINRIRLDQLLEKPEDNDNLNDRNESYRWLGVTDYKNFAVYKYKNCIAECWTIEDRFWASYGQSMTSLTITDCRILTRKDLRKLFSCVATPKLKKLKLHGCIFRGAVVATDNVSLAAVESMSNLNITYADHSQRLPISWIELIHCYPKLQVLKLKSVEKENDTMDLVAVAQSMKNIVEASSSSSSSSASHQNNNVKVFPYPLLRKLRLGISIAEDLPLIYSILEDQRDITCFTLDGTSDISMLKIPSLPNLTKLKLLHCSMDTMSFLTSCPNLNELIIRKLQPHFSNSTAAGITTNLINNVHEDGGWDQAKKDALRIPSLKKYKCNYVLGYSVEDIFCLKQWMTSLCHLEIHLDDVSFRAVCQHFPQLKTLNVLCSLITDKGIIGCNNIPQILLQGTSWSPKRRNSNITHLKALEKFAIRACSYTRFRRRTVVPLTRLSCIHGFLKLKPMLKLLHVSPRAITAEGHMLLEKKHPGYETEFDRDKWL